MRHQEGLGFGDVKMLAMIGAFLGWKLMLLTLVGGVDPRLADRRRADGGAGAPAWQSKLPLGTFLAVAAILASLFGDAVVEWYLGSTVAGSWQLTRSSGSVHERANPSGRLAQPLSPSSR